MFPSLAWLLVALTLGGSLSYNAPSDDGGRRQLTEADSPGADTDATPPPIPPGK